MQFAMSILCVLACVYWSQSARAARRARLDSDLEEQASKGRSASHQRTQSMNEKYIISGGNSTQMLIQRKVDQSIIRNGGLK